MSRVNYIKKYLDQYQAIVIDGAMATELEKKGCDINHALWSAKILAENPDAIKEVHLSYYSAGADVAITASYQATIEGFVKEGFSKNQARELLQKSVIIAKEAREEYLKTLQEDSARPYPLVAASVGPYGAYLADGSEYRGDYDLGEESLIEFHRERMQLLIQQEPDLLAVETIPNLEEARGVARLMEELDAPYGWISFSCKNGTQISSGELLCKCAEELEAYDKVAAIGINCTAPEYISSLIGEIRKVSQKPIIVYPNSGEEYHADTKTWSVGKFQDKYCDCAKRWRFEGASLIGGCCKTTPVHIREVAEFLRSK